MSHLTDRKTVSETALVARAAAVLLLLGMALAVFGRPSWLQPPSAEEPVVRPPQAQPEQSDQDEPARRPIDVAFLAESMGRFANAPAPETPEGEPGGGEDDGADSEQTDADPDATGGGGDDAGPEIEFLGAVLSPSRRVAVVRLGQKQHWIAEGEQKAGVRVLMVTEDSCVLQRKDAEPRRIDRAERTGSPVATLGPGEGGADADERDAEGRTLGSSRADGEVIDPEERRRRRIEELRERARERRFNRRDAGEEEH